MIAFGRKTANLKFESYNGGRDSKERLTQVGFPIEVAMEIISGFDLQSDVSGQIYTRISTIRSDIKFSILAPRPDIRHIDDIRLIFTQWFSQDQT